MFPEARARFAYAALSVNISSKPAPRVGDSVYVVFLAGGIASGKSTVARELQKKGARCIDLDQLSREVTEAGSSVNQQIALVFGEDVLDGEGNLRRSVLAQRAFLSEEHTRALEEIVHPEIRKLLLAWINNQDEDAICVVEIPLLDRVEDLLPLADEVMCVTCPIDIRRTRAVGRGMMEEDFDARARHQPTEAYLASKATTLLSNDGNERELIQKIDRWWEARCASNAS